MKINKVFATSVMIFAMFSAMAESIVVTLAANSYTNNVIPAVTGAVKVTGIAVTSAGATPVNTWFFDTTSVAPPVLTNAAYNTISASLGTVATNYVNYFGVTNYVTNTAIVYTTNAVAAGSTPVPALVNVSGTASATVIAPDLNYVFHKGISISNTTAGTGSVTITYQR